MCAVLKKVVAPMVLLLASYCSPQNNPARVAGAPRVTITLPDSIEPQTVWIRYALVGPGGTGGRIQTIPNVRQYVVDGNGHEVRIVVYAPGCQFGTYVVTPSDGSEGVERFECQTLATKTIHGHIDPEEIPRTIYSETEKRLDIVGELEADWICNFFFAPPHASNVKIGGSCLVPTVPLANLGVLDPARRGSFDIAIPDFGGDRAFRSNDGLRTDYIEMALHDKTVGAVMGIIKPKSAPSHPSGLKVQASYPEEMTFARGR